MQVGRENRDYLQELQRQRTAAGDRDDLGTESEGSREAVAVPVSTGSASSAPREAEDLDIPAFLRRSR